MDFLRRRLGSFLAKEPPPWWQRLRTWLPVMLVFILPLIAIHEHRLRTTVEAIARDGVTAEGRITSVTYYRSNSAVRYEFRDALGRQQFGAQEQIKPGTFKAGSTVKVTYSGSRPKASAVNMPLLRQQAELATRAKAYWPFLLALVLVPFLPTRRLFRRFGPAVIATGLAQPLTSPASR